jgi:LPXTG-motif cell wall-anchored protein
VSANTALIHLFCFGNQLLDIIGLPTNLNIFDASDQTVAVPVQADPDVAGSYLSVATYDFGAHTIALDSTAASFDTVTKRFATTSLDTPIDFETDDGTDQVISGTITFTSPPPPPPPSDAKDITSFTLAGRQATITGTTIAVTVPYGTDVSALTPAITHTGVSISPTGAQNFSAPLTYTVTAEDGSTKPYTVTATVDTTVPIITAPDTWTGSGSATVRLDSPVENFVRVTLNGAEVDPANYTVTSGSTIITFKEDYLKTLPEGTHTFTVIFKDGQAEVPITISASASEGGGKTTGGDNNLPKTGDTTSLALMTSAVLLVLLGVCLLGLRRTTAQRKGAHRSSPARRH